MRKFLLLLLTVMSCLAVNAQKTYTFQLTDNWTVLEADGAWGTSYLERTIVQDGATLVFTKANHSTQTITDCPVTKGQPFYVTLSNADAHILSAEVQCEQWLSKAQTITLNYSTNGGTDYTAATDRSYDFEPYKVEFTADQAVNAVKWTFNSTSNQVGIKYVTVVTDEEDTPAPIITVAKPTFSVAAGDYYEAVDVEITDETEGAAIQYSTDGETYADYTSAINVAETTTLYAKAVKGEDESDVVSATYTIAKTYASLADLAENETATADGVPVIVTFEKVAIDSIYVTAKGYRNGIYLTAGDKAIEIYCYDVPTDWEVGGKVSGTLKCLYKDFKGTSELCPSSWDDITYDPLQFANDFEDGTIGDWTTVVPADPYKGGFTVVDYASTSSLKEANVGTNDLGGTYCLQSLTGATNKVKGNSDNWFISPAVTIADATSVFSFRLAANCSYSPTKEDAEKMQMDVVVIDGADSTVVATVAPENYFTWKQYAVDLSAYLDKKVQVAFHDYGTAGSGAIGDMKYIDNIKLGAEALADYAIEEVTPVYGQADYTPAYIVRVTNYGLSKGTFNVSYTIDDTTTAETVESTIANGQSLEYTFTKAPVFYPGTHTFNVSVEAESDAMTANNAIAEQTVVANEIQALPYSVANVLDDESTDNDDLVETEFATATSSSKSKWAYDAVKYNAWIYSLTNASKQGEGYLYTTKAFTLAPGKYTLKTIGTATLTDNYYEVYVAKYGAEGMNAYATKVGQSEILRDVTTTETIDTTNVALEIPEAGTYVLGLRPMTATKNAQMAIIGYSIEKYEEPLTAAFDPADGAELASFEKNDKITMTLSNPDKVGYVYWSLKDNNAEDENNTILRTGYMKQNEDKSWYAKFYSQQKLLDGHTYTVTSYCYATEADSQGDTSYANTIAQFTATYTGTTKAYEYADATIESISPEEGTELKTISDNVITVKFSEAIGSLKANINGGQSGDNAECACATEDYVIWTITIPQEKLAATSGSININVYAADADGRAVKGDNGEDENSYTILSYVTYLGSPEFTVTPESGSVVDKVDVIRVSYPEGINYSYNTTEMIKVYVNNEFWFFMGLDDLTPAEDFSYIDVKIPEDRAPLDEVGTYKIVFPAKFFSLGEEYTSYMSKEQTVEYTILPASEGLAADPAPGEVESLTTITFTYNNGENITPYSGTITVTDAAGNVLASFDRDYLWDHRTVVEGETWLDTRTVAVSITFDEPITAPGTYTVNIPYGLFIVGDDREYEATQFVYTIPEVSAIVLSTTADTTDAPAYNINGQRVKDNVKGVVIKNGKKYIQK